MQESIKKNWFSPLVSLIIGIFVGGGIVLTYSFLVGDDQPTRGGVGGVGGNQARGNIVPENMTDEERQAFQENRSAGGGVGRTGSGRTAGGGGTRSTDVAPVENEDPIGGSEALGN